MVRSSVLDRLLQICILSKIFIPLSIIKKNIFPLFGVIFTHFSNQPLLYFLYLVGKDRYLFILSLFLLQLALELKYLLFQKVNLLVFSIPLATRLSRFREGYFSIGFYNNLGSRTLLV